MSKIVEAKKAAANEDKAPTFRVTTDTKAVSTMIGNIERRLKSIDADLPFVMASAILHAVEHGDTSLATRFADVVAKGHTRGNAVKKVMQDRGPLIWSKAEKISKEKSLPARFTLDAERIEAFRERMKNDKEALVKELLVPFWETDPDSEADKPFMLLPLLAKLVERADKRTEKPKAGDDIPQAVLDQLHTLLKGRTGGNVKAA